jgi:hypothetical protein
MAGNRMHINIFTLWVLIIMLSACSTEDRDRPLHFEFTKTGALIPPPESMSAFRLFHGGQGPAAAFRVYQNRGSYSTSGVHVPGKFYDWGILSLPGEDGWHKRLPL